VRRCARPSDDDLRASGEGRDAVAVRLDLLADDFAAGVDDGEIVATLSASASH
jgi:hypothetical protein